MSDLVKEIDDALFEEQVLFSKKPVLVDFWAPWCGPCKMVGPVIEDLAGEMSDVSFVKVNVDQSRDFAAQYGVRNIPTLLVFKNGELVAKQVGALNKQKMKEFIEQATA
ncbi:MAG: thioredoxin [Ruminobacter sp.]|jgi:thioredoxin 1|uniref:Thioredoxin n=1 Tax=Ruminobacter amylophilus TaxID=867 RepID=A0A662ZI26_9GAMM|nr:MULTISPECIES: thioredoxin [Ruminobacter]MBQ3774751.1 thioredoxin [Ruminobacter sp.]SFP29247.1 thioredoxin [Ruminobacter amylophilus]